MENNREKFALRNFIGIMKSCRRQLVEDVFCNDYDLYNFLCEDKKHVRILYRQLYELKWLELHWKKCELLIDEKNLPLATRREILKIFLRRYSDFVAGWDYKPTDAVLFKANIESLNTLIITEKQWTEQLNQLKTSFLLETKALDKLIEEAK